MELKKPQALSFANALNNRSWQHNKLFLYNFFINLNAAAAKS
jgi:hypothetical protein